MKSTSKDGLPAYVCCAAVDIQRNEGCAASGGRDPQGA